MSKVLTMTSKRIERLISARQGQLGHHRDPSIPGLYLQVTRLEQKDQRAAASWILRFQRDGKEFQMGLGSLVDVSLEAARKKAQAARAQLAEGTNPLLDRKAEKQKRKAAGVTFADAARQVYEARKKGQAEITSTTFIRCLEIHAFPVFGQIPVGEVDRSLVLQVLRPLWNSQRETGQRVRSAIERVLDHAEAHGLRTGTNSARWESLKVLLGASAADYKVTHHKAMPYEELPKFVQQLRKREGTAAAALEFTILTAARTGETIGATWDEIDLDEKLWVIPAERMKMSRPHRVPLSDRAVAILKALPREDKNPYVFIGAKTGRGLSNMSMSILLQKRMKIDATVHGFRSSFRDWTADNAYPRDAAELALAHLVGKDDTERSYLRTDMLDRRRHMMADWSDYCSGKTVATGATVIPLRGANHEQ
jgi:integrase